jgi:2-oxoisovalerate dehydrogenase E1 component alpha subunit
VRAAHAASAHEAYNHRAASLQWPATAIPPRGHDEKEWHVTTETIQLLTPEGMRTDHPDYPLGDVDVLGMYRDMTLVRRIDNEAVALQRQGELALWAPLLGQEAAQIGSARALSARDMAFPSYREHGVAWCRGLDMMRVFELFRGVTNGAWDPEEHKFHLYTVVIGDQTLHATGYAMGIQRDGSEDEAAIVYFGDGATSQGIVSEAFSWASVFHAPVVFFCQNNQFAISAPPERQSRAPIYQRAAGFGFPGVQVDGNDVLACYAVTRQALRNAHEGQGPTLIEAYTYRMGAHTTTDDPTRYRTASEVETWRLRDPIERVRAYLARSGEADSAFFEQVQAEADELAAKLRAAVLALPDPLPLALFDNVLADGSAILDAERAQYAAYLESFAEQGAAR